MEALLMEPVKVHQSWLALELEGLMKVQVMVQQSLRVEEMKMVVVKVQESLSVPESLWVQQSLWVLEKEVHLVQLWAGRWA